MLFHSIKFLKRVAILVICNICFSIISPISGLFSVDHFINCKITILCLVLKIFPGPFEVLIGVKYFKTRHNTQWSITFQTVETCLFAQPRSHRPTYFTVRFVFWIVIPLDEMSFFQPGVFIWHMCALLNSFFCQNFPTVHQ